MPAWLQAVAGQQPARQRRPGAVLRDGRASQMRQAWYWVVERAWSSPSERKTVVYTFSDFGTVAYRVRKPVRNPRYVGLKPLKACLTSSLGVPKTVNRVGVIAAKNRCANVSP